MALSSVTSPDSGRIIRDTVECLKLVDEGLSERSSVEKVVHTSSERRLVLKYVLDIVSQLDSIDPIVKRMFSSVGKKSTVWNFGRVSYYLLSRSEKTRLSDLVHNLRESCPQEAIVALERLAGLVFRSDREIVGQHTQDDEVKIAAQTHNLEWWTKYCCRLMGRGQAIKFLSSKTRPRYVHINPLRNGGSWSTQGLPREFEPILHKTVEEYVYRLDSHPSTLSNRFSTGLFQIQDLASFLAVKAGGARPTENVLDVCAAPGTKTCTLAQFMMNQGSILSVDLSRSRFEVWRRQTTRTGVTIAQPIITDATLACIDGKFDLVLVDPPCSGSGIFDRNPLMKWHVSPESLRHYSSIQQKILEEASRLVREGGRLVYNTCSITIEENEHIVSSFLKAHPWFRLRPVFPNIGSPGLDPVSQTRRFYPHVDGTAGYFIARLENTGGPS